VQKKIYITIKTSDTMLLLVNSLTEEYMKENADVEFSTEICASSEGLEALLGKTAAISASSRPISDKELKRADQNKIEIKEYSIARDALVFIVNPDNPVKEISMDNIIKIFTGTYTNWKDSGYKDIPISVYTSENTSGTYMFFKSAVLKEKCFSTKIKMLTNIRDIIETVSKEEGAISYIIYEYSILASDKIKIIGIKNDKSSEMILPTEENIKKGRYPIVRNLYFYTRSDASADINKFIGYCLSPEGQKIVKKAKCITLK